MTTWIRKPTADLVWAILFLAVASVFVAMQKAGWHLGLLHYVLDSQIWWEKGEGERIIRRAKP